jgi:hypothetical protein
MPDPTPGDLGWPRWAVEVSKDLPDWQFERIHVRRWRWISPDGLSGEGSPTQVHQVALHTKRMRAIADSLDEQSVALAEARPRNVVAESPNVEMFREWLTYYRDRNERPTWPLPETFRPAMESAETAHSLRADALELHLEATKLAKQARLREERSIALYWAAEEADRRAILRVPSPDKEAP